MRQADRLTGRQADRQTDRDYQIDKYSRIGRQLETDSQTTKQENGDTGEYIQIRIDTQTFVIYSFTHRETVCNLDLIWLWTD